MLKFEFFAIIISKAQNSAAKNAKKSPNKLEEIIIRPLSFLETDITTPEKAKINPSSLIKESFSLYQFLDNIYSSLIWLQLIEMVEQKL